MDHPNLEEKTCQIFITVTSVRIISNPPVLKVSWPQRSMQQLHVIDEMLTLRLHRFHLYPVSKLCFLYSGDLSGKPSPGEVNGKVVSASNWDTSFRERHSHF